MQNLYEISLDFFLKMLELGINVDPLERLPFFLIDLFRRLSVPWRLRINIQLVEQAPTDILEHLRLCHWIHVRSVDSKLLTEGIDCNCGGSHQILTRKIGQQHYYFFLEGLNRCRFLAFPPRVVTLRSQCACGIPLGPFGQFDEYEFPTASNHIVDSLKVLFAVLLLSFLGKSSEFYDRHAL